MDDQGTHITASDLIATLKNMNVVNVKDMYYMALYGGSRTLEALETHARLQLDFKQYKPAVLNKIVKNPQRKKNTYNTLKKEISARIDFI